MEEDMSAIVYDKVTKKIGNRTLIDQVSFTVEQGEIFARQLRP